MAPRMCMRTRGNINAGQRIDATIILTRSGVENMNTKINILWRLRRPFMFMRPGEEEF